MLQAVRHGDYAPLAFYAVAVIFCLALTLDTGKINSRSSQRTVASGSRACRWWQTAWTVSDGGAGE